MGPITRLPASFLLLTATSTMLADQPVPRMVHGPGGTPTAMGREIQACFGRQVVAGDVPVVERGMLRGLVTDGAISERVAGAQLLLDDGEVLRTGRDGWYEAGRFTPADGRDRASHVTSAPEFFAPRFVPVAPGSEPLPPIGFKPGARVIGRIVDDVGKPLTDVCIIPLVDPIDSPGPSLCNPLWLNKR